MTAVAWAGEEASVFVGSRTCPFAGTRGGFVLLSDIAEIFLQLTVVAPVSGLLLIASNRHTTP